MITSFTNTSAAIYLQNGGTLGLNPGTNQVVTDIKGWHGSAGVRRTSTEKLWQHGTFAERGWKGERVVTLEAHITAQSRAEAAHLCDDFAAILGDGEIGTFQVTDLDQGVRWITVQLSGAVEVDWDGENEIDLTVDMVSTDPRKFGPVQTYTTNTSRPGGGLDNDPSLFNSATDVLDFGEGGDAGTITINNTGKAPVTVVFEVQGFLTDNGFTITEVGTGRRLRYALAQSILDTVILDSADGTVLLNGVSDRSDYLVERDWPTIMPGINTYLFEALDGSAVLTAKAGSAWW